MSYSRNYSGEVFYSGHVNVSYPASEHGGTTSASYSGYVPVSIDLFVDTSPFDNSVRHCKSSINGLSAAVVGMESAQIKAIKKSAEEISNTVTDGFFNMVKSEISQEMSALYSKFNAISDLLEDRSATLEKQQLIMKNDYDRTSVRYNEIFQNLDEELEKRITALDKKVIDISRHVQNEQLHNKVALNVAKVLTGINEDEMITQQLLIANANARVSKTLSDLSQNVVQEMVYAKKMQKILRDKSSEENVDITVPVIYMESDDLNVAELKSQNCFVSNVSGAEKIQGDVKNYFTTENMNWKKQQNENVEDAFLALAEKSLADGSENAKRIYDTIMFLKNNSETELN